MHYLSQYQLSVVDARALRLTDAYSLHRIVYSLFDDVRAGDRSTSSGILFADKGMLQGCRTVLICSSRMPRAAARGRLLTKELHDAYMRHTDYFFEIIINPVRRCNASGKIVPIRGNDAVLEWFLRKSPGLGFEITHLELKDYHVDCFKKGNSQGIADATIAKATLTGTLHVTDVQAFSHSVLYGIGRAKAFGCGLLQIAPCK